MPSGRGARLVAIVICLLVGSFATGASVLTSFSASTFIIQEDAIQSELHSRQTVNVARPIAEFYKAQLKVARLGEQMKVAAKEASLREAAEGGSCGSTRPGEGPITRLRALHSVEAAQHSSAASEMAEAGSALLTSLRVATIQAEVDSVYGDVEKLLLDPRLLEIQDWSGRTARDLRGARIPFEGRSYVCVDTAMADMLDRLHQAAMNVPTLPEFAPQIREGNVFDSMVIMFGRLSSIVSGNQPSAKDLSIIPYLLFSLMIDLVGLVSAIFTARYKTDRLTPKKRAEYVRFTWAIRHLIWTFEDGETYLVVPVGGDPDKETLARHLIARLRMSPRPFRFRVPITILIRDVPDLPHYYSSMTGKPTLVDIFRLNEKSEILMHELYNEAILALEYDAREYSNYPASRGLSDGMRQFSVVN